MYTYHSNLLNEFTVSSPWEGHWLEVEENVDLTQLHKCCVNLNRLLNLSEV